MVQRPDPPNRPPKGKARRLVDARTELKHKRRAEQKRLEEQDKEDVGGDSRPAEASSKTPSKKGKSVAAAPNYLGIFSLFHSPHNSKLAAAVAERPMANRRAFEKTKI